MTNFAYLQSPEPPFTHMQPKRGFVPTPGVFGSSQLGVLRAAAYNKYDTSAMNLLTRFADELIFLIASKHG
jgi:hypothetical protein